MRHAVKAIGLTETLLSEQSIGVLHSGTLPTGVLKVVLQKFDHSSSLWMTDLPPKTPHSFGFS